HAVRHIGDDPGRHPRRHARQAGGVAGHRRRRARRAGRRDRQRAGDGGPAALLERGRHLRDQPRRVHGELRYTDRCAGWHPQRRHLECGLGVVESGALRPRGRRAAVQARDARHVVRQVALGGPGVPLRGLRKPHPWGEFLPVGDSAAEPRRVALAREPRIAHAVFLAGRYRLHQRSCGFYGERQDGHPDDELHPRRPRRAGLGARRPRQLGPGTLVRCHGGRGARPGHEQVPATIRCGVPGPVQLPLLGAGEPVVPRAHRVGTFYEGYYRTTKDARAKWDSTGMSGDAAVAKFGGSVPFWPEAKYATTAAPVRLSSGWEMRLIEAEAAFTGGNAAAAVDSMNRRRANLSLPLYERTVSLDSAWTLLKTERAVELWLETRRLGDLRRWITHNVPGAYIDGTYRGSSTDFLHATPIETMTAPAARALCLAVGRNERETNPNVP